MTAKILTDETHQMFLVDEKLKRLCKIFLINVDGPTTKRPIGDGQFLEEFYSVMIVDKPIQPEFKIFGVYFPKYQFSPVVEILNCQDLRDGRYLLSFRADLRPG
jgi:hypothetical protein